ncbi:MAG: DUF4391 domain-containing protein [Rhizobiales bacterium]|nr:DUF4391 domain-containing protein [Hyphomicrobiales bacterium]
MIQNFLDSLGIPQKCFLNKTLFKKLFLENCMLDITDKKALKDDIDKIRWLYTLKPSTINIESFKDDTYEYDEVAILQIDLTSPTSIKRIASFVNKAIPYPLILIFTHGDMIVLHVADKRTNHADKAKWVVEDGWITHWFHPSAPTQSEQGFMEDIAIKNLSFLNFYAFYSDVKNCVIALNSAQRSGTYSIASQEQTDFRLKSLKQIDELEKEMAELRASLKKEKQFNTRLKLNVAVKECQDTITQLEQDL